MPECKLNVRIEKLRGRMEKAAAKYGLMHPLTLAISRRLDRLINEAMERRMVA